MKNKLVLYGYQLCQCHHSSVTAWWWNDKNIVVLIIWKE